MHEPNLFKIFTDKLNELKAEYMITGSVASIIYGEPRVTHDIDIVITLPKILIDRILKLFPIEDFYLPPKEIILNEIYRESRGHFNIIHHDTGFKADIYIAGNEEFQRWALENVNEIDFYGDKLPIAPPEYVIIKKLEFYNEGSAQKHISDIKAILEQSVEMIDFKKLNNYVLQFGLTKAWELCSK